ncbi:MAG: hypothetical protein K6U14_05220 [Firmicutes bacterium]|nr:hypothetical protein [Alicyclobacillaceae bacterium]MCL6497019.1 hypothetical protein [Bacillota bacterium]
MEQARLIRRLKEQYHVKPGRPWEGQGTANSAKMAELAQILEIPERTLRRLDRLNDLIPALQALAEPPLRGGHLLLARNYVEPTFLGAV